MKTIYCVAAAVLLAALLILGATVPGVGEAPVIYWKTWPSEMRTRQVELFREWLRENGHADIDLRIDFDSTGATNVIQGVSGVGADLMETASQGGLRFLRDAGILMDLTEDAAAHGYGPGSYFRNIEPDLFVEGRQYAYPRMVATIVMIYNKEVFRELGMDIPPQRLDFSTFERIGREFLAKTEPEPGRRRTRFFTTGISPQPLFRSLGVDVFNETMTASAINDERVVRVLEMIKRWTEEGILMSQSDMGSLTAEGGTTTFGPRLYNFQRGNIAIIGGGRYVFQGIRLCGEVDMGAMEFPNGGFPNTWQNPVSVSVYAGTKHPREALLFMRFLASEEFNMSVVDYCDGEPPDFKYARTDRFLKPPGYPGEWDAHRAILEIAENTAVPIPCSPYIDQSLEGGIVGMMSEKVQAGVLGAEAATREAAARIDAEIARSLRERPWLRESYQEDVARQEKIERLRREGQLVPAELISNPFHQAYYKFMGWSE